ncbi:MAG: GNAT family N-acetyltransferase [Methanocorpusculum sp.]|nr:GNAT family N-acetyltransferase [Methanocorpusculum sp.]
MSSAEEKNGTEDTLCLKPVGENSPDRELLSKMYAEAFPANEWQPGSVALIQNTVSDVWKIDEWLIMDGSEAIGLLCIVHSEIHAYLLYLAVSPQCQGRGYGSRVLGLFKKMYPGHIRFFDLEVPDDSAENAEQRRARIRFYERNGYHLTDFVFESEGVKLVVMTDSDRFALTGELAELSAALEPYR